MRKREKRVEAGAARQTREADHGSRLEKGLRTGHTGHFSIPSVRVAKGQSGLSILSGKSLAVSRRTRECANKLAQRQPPLNSMPDRQR